MKKELIKDKYGIDEISLCKGCCCMTKTYTDGKCGKCGYLKGTGV